MLAWPHISLWTIVVLFGGYAILDIPDRRRPWDPRRVGVAHEPAGSCPGMNAVLRAVVKAAEHEHGIEIVGFRDGFAGLLADDSLPLGFDDVSGILVQGGTILGASNKDDPFRVPTASGPSSTYADRSDAPPGPRLRDTASTR